jgi:hypothetical protein
MDNNAGGSAEHVQLLVVIGPGGRLLGLVVLAV